MGLFIHGIYVRRLKFDKPGSTFGGEVVIYVRIYTTMPRKWLFISSSQRYPYLILVQTEAVRTQMHWNLPQATQWAKYIYI